MRHVQLDTQSIDHDDMRLINALKIGREAQLRLT